MSTDERKAPQHRVAPPDVRRDARDGLAIRTETGCLVVPGLVGRNGRHAARADVELSDGERIDGTLARRRVVHESDAAPIGRDVEVGGTWVDAGQLEARAFEQVV